MRGMLCHTTISRINSMKWHCCCTNRPRHTVNSCTIVVQISDSCGNDSQLDMEMSSGISISFHGLELRAPSISDHQCNSFLIFDFFGRDAKLMQHILVQAFEHKCYQWSVKRPMCRHLLNFLRSMTVCNDRRILVPALSTSFLVKPLVMQTFSAGCGCHGWSRELAPIVRGMARIFVIITSFFKACVWSARGSLDFLFMTRLFNHVLDNAFLILDGDVISWD